MKSLLIHRRGENLEPWELGRLLNDIQVSRRNICYQSRGMTLSQMSVLPYVVIPPRHWVKNLEGNHPLLYVGYLRTFNFNTSH